MRYLAALLLVAIPVGQPAFAQNVEAARFNPDAVMAYSDSFVSVIQGQARGWHRYSLERTATGLRFTDVFSLGDVLERATRVVLTSQLQVLSVTAEGRQFGQVIGADIRYTGQHAGGWATHARENGPVRSHIDTLLPPNAFDGSALMALLPTVEWRVGAVYSLTLFDTDELNITTQILRIVAEEEVTVPAGTFSAYRADLSTTEAPVSLWYTRSRPHRLVKIGGESEAFMTVLVSRTPP